jgi:hypothetical protein
MAFDRENLSIVVNNMKSGVVPASHTYYNDGDDDVTAASFFSDLRLRAGDEIKVTSDDYLSVTRYYVASVTTAGVVTLGGGISTIVADGTALTLSDIIAFDTTAEAFSYTLPDGVEGQKLIMVMTVDGGNDAVITPANLAAGATLTFADANDSCTMLFINSTWQITSLEGVAVA